MNQEAIKSKFGLQITEITKEEAKLVHPCPRCGTPIKQLAKTCELCKDKKPWDGRYTTLGGYYTSDKQDRITQGNYDLKR
jgi:hypothetical protein